MDESSGGPGLCDDPGDSLLTVVSRRTPPSGRGLPRASLGWVGHHRDRCGPDVLLLGILVILAIITANGYFVAQEFAYMSVDRVRLTARAEAGDAAAERALTVTRRTSFMLSGAQLGITVTGLLVGYVAEPLIGESLGTIFGGVGVPTAVGARDRCRAGVAVLHPGPDALR